MTRPDDIERLADTPVDVLTPERIGNILEAENLEYRLEDAPLGPDGEPMTLVRTGFNNCAITFAIDSGQLLAEALWRGIVPADKAADLLFAINNFNQTQIAPTLRFFERDEGGLAVSAIRQLPAGEGMSRKQIGAFVMSTIEAFTRAFIAVEEAYPDSVTWAKENDHDH